MIMIPQPYKYGSRARQPGACCGGKGCRRVSGGLLVRPVLHTPSRTGGEEMKICFSEALETDTVCGIHPAKEGAFAR